MAAADLEMRQLHSHFPIPWTNTLGEPFLQEQIFRYEKKRNSLQGCAFESNLSRDIKHRILCSVCDIRLHTLIPRTGSRHLGVKRLAESRHAQVWGNGHIQAEYMMVALVAHGDTYDCKWSSPTWEHDINNGKPRKEKQNNAFSPFRSPH